jgi:bifunctional ADP-heptose synthase (sugar kinase/adenylyltransferase)
MTLHGSEWLERHGGQVILAPLLPGRSTTNILAKVQNGQDHASVTIQPSY